MQGISPALRAFSSPTDEDDDADERPCIWWTHSVPRGPNGPALLRVRHLRGRGTLGSAPRPREPRCTRSASLRPARPWLRKGACLVRACHMMRRADGPERPQACPGCCAASASPGAPGAVHDGNGGRPVVGPKRGGDLRRSRTNGHRSPWLAHSHGPAPAGIAQTHWQHPAVRKAQHMAGTHGMCFAVNPERPEGFGGKTNLSLISVADRISIAKA